MVCAHFSLRYADEWAASPKYAFNLLDSINADPEGRIGFSLQRCGFHKRSGIEVDPILYCLTMWVWLKSNSVSLFARDSLRTFCAAGKDVLYEAMNREDWNWRALHLRVARKAIQQLVVSDSATAFVLDDTIKIRSGKRCPVYPAILITPQGGTSWASRY
jgi:hypothetical protein